VIGAADGFGNEVIRFRGQRISRTQVGITGNCGRDPAMFVAKDDLVAWW
jgi:hypothetical protein